MSAVSGGPGWWLASDGAWYPPELHPDAGAGPEVGDPEIDRGTAGGSALATYERLHDNREKRVEAKWGRLAPIAKALAPEPQSTRAWKKGGGGEVRVARNLERLVGDRAVLLHDRSVPGTGGNIDTIAVASSGIWVIDAKDYKGKVERRDKGGLFKTDFRLYVGGRDRTKIAQAMGWQVAAVKGAAGGAPVHAALCFVEADWGLFAQPFRIDGVWVTWVKALAKKVGAPGSLSEGNVEALARQVADRLPAKRT